MLTEHLCNQSHSKWCAGSSATTGCVLTALVSVFVASSAAQQVLFAEAIGSCGPSAPMSAVVSKLQTGHKLGMSAHAILMLSQTALKVSKVELSGRA